MAIFLCPFSQIQNKMQDGAFRINCQKFTMKMTNY